MDTNAFQYRARELHHDASPRLVGLPDGERRRHERHALGIPSMPDVKLLCAPAYCCDVSGAVLSYNSAACALWGQAPQPGRRGEWSGAAHMFGPDGARLRRSSYPCAQAVATGANLDNLFQPYTQFEACRGRFRAGAGLGLPIAKEICERHGGHISARSDGPGCGSMFTITLPCRFEA